MDKENHLFNILEEYRSACILWLRNKGASDEDAEDCVQVAMATILKKVREANHFSPAQFGPSFLYDIAKKRLWDIWKNKNTGHSRLDQTPADLLRQEADFSLDVDDHESRQAQHKAIRAIFERFNAKRGQFLFDSLIERKSTATLAIHYQMTEGSVIATVSKLNSEFRKWIQNQDAAELYYDLFRRYLMSGHWPWDRHTNV